MINAPTGYQIGAKKAFSKGTSQKVISLVQVAGGNTLKITNVKGTTSTPLPGACFGIYRQVNGKWEVVTVRCDADDGANDGATRILALPPGTYQVIETFVPKGYKQPAPTNVTLGTGSKSITVHTSTS